MHKLNADFYIRDEVDLIAKELLGKVLVVQSGKKNLAARIVETEAYAGVIDAASHAFKNKRTERTETMYMSGGSAYVYLCYGMHNLFNVVTNKKEIPHAVLIRAVEPLFEVSTPTKKNKRLPGSGPALVTKLLGIDKSHNGISLLKDQIYIAEDGYKPKSIAVSPRIGVDYAGNAAKWLYRFFIDEHKHVTPHIYNKTAIKIIK
jgi:DNA-3-methyladenine glycosylase